MELPDLTYQQILEAPLLVQQIYIAAQTRGVIGGTTYERAIKEHPEYFPEEVERRRVWDAIPQSVHDAYWEEIWTLEKRVKVDMPPSKGMLYWIANPEEHEQWLREGDKCAVILKPFIKDIHEKYYKGYGIEYKGW